MSGGDVALPPLREDLRLHAAAPERDGAPAWMIQDPVSNRFFRIGWLEFECLLRWPGKPEQIAASIAAETPLNPDAGQVLSFAAFLERNHLIRPGEEALKRLARANVASGWRQWRWWLHHYLFFRIPLVRPERWLKAMLPLLRPLGSPAGLGLVALASAGGLLLVLRQWDVFQHSIGEILTPAGIVGFMLAVILAKTCHELGHALVATRYGVRVAHMGVAFVVMWPMLYTDTSESWKLKNSRQRLAVSTAGIAVEMCLAGLATLGWALLDDGPLRQAMLYLATTGWVLTLVLNINPFFRFDGYFILSDLLDLPNLHERSGALARAWLRRRLFGWDEPDPEPVSVRLGKFLVAFALTTWVLRFITFIGIAIAVYLFFFKALGIFLFAVEISWFIFRPLASELSVWRRRRAETTPHHRFWLILVLALITLVLLIPWAGHINAPAYAHAARKQTVFSPFAARILALSPPGAVHAGATLAVFESPDLLAQSQRSGASVDAVSRRLKGLHAQEDGLDQRRATSERLVELLAEQEASLGEIGRLRINAEFDGIWLGLDPDLRVGGWVGNREAVGMLVTPGQWVVEAYVEQRQIERLRLGAKAIFYPESAPLESVAAKVIEIDTTRSARLLNPMLDSRHGGHIATQSGDKDGIPTEALYRVYLELASPLPELHETRGRVAIDGERRSLVWQGIKNVMAVLIRESGF